MTKKRYKAEFHSFYTDQTFIYGNKWLAYESHMNLSLLALNLLLTSIHCRTKFKMLSIDHKAFYCLDPTYFPILIFTILSSPIQEFYTQVSWTNCSSCSLDLLTLLTLLGTSSSPLLFHSSSISDAHQFPHKIFSFPQEELISCISQVS